MDCKQLQEQVVEAAAGRLPSEPARAAELQAHLSSCAGCAAQVAEMRGTMALLDEWQAPEPSPYFGSRLRARLREEAARASSWLERLRKPAAAFATALLIVAGLWLFQGGADPSRGPELAQPVGQPASGSAVADLQALEEHHELYAQFELLDALDEDVTP